MEIQQHEAEATRNALLAVAALIVALLAVGFAVYYFRQQRIIRHKNRVIVRQMKESLTPSLTPGPSPSLTPGPSPSERGVDTSSTENSTVHTNHSPLRGRGAGGEASERGAGG